MKINNLSPSALKIFEVLHKKGYEAFVVGGFVRDSILRIPSTDIDIVTSALPDQIIELFPNDKVDLVGKSFGVVLVNGIEVASYRNDKYFGLSDKNSIIEFGTLDTDAARRDFTINSIFFDPISGVIFDPNKGMRDIRNKIIKFVGNPKDRIFEDPNRMIRACRFRSQIGGIFHPDTFNALREFAHFLDAHVAVERIRMEIIKAMKTKKSSDFFNALREIDALRYIFPSLNSCVEVGGGIHHGEDVYTHNLISGNDISPKFPLIKLSGFLHDVGKPISKRLNPNTGNVWFEGHADTGVEILEQELRDLTFSNEEIATITGLVKLHMRISFGMGPKAIRKLLRNLCESGLSYRDLLRLRHADMVANLRKSFNPKSFKDAVRKFRREIVGNKNEPFNLKSLKVNGKDVMDTLSIQPGPNVGKILNTLFEEVLEDPSRDEKDFLIERIKIIWEEWWRK
jgi:tRNA nucleotidyltransferase/poly(A) polymerase